LPTTYHGAAAHAADVQAFALAKGKEEHARMLADDRTVRVAHLAGPGRQVLTQELAKIALADETDAGGVLLVVHRQPGFAGQAAQVRLVQVADREQRGCQLLLPELVQEVALVLAGIDAAQQVPAAAALLDARVVAGGDLLGAQRARGIDEMLELDLAVAQHVRIGRAPGGVLGQEVGEYPVPVLLREIAEMEGNAEPPADGHRVAAILLGAASARRRGLSAGEGGRAFGDARAVLRLARTVIGPVLHEQARHRHAGLDQLQRRHRRIHAAGHAHHHARGRAHASRLTAESGKRRPAR
jgi:hypothetical protein